MPDLPQISVSSANLEELGLPSTIYKYRTWTNPYHLRILSDKEIFMASPRSFNDPLDCKIPVRVDLLTDKEIFEKYLYQSKKDHKDWNRSQHRTFAQEWTRKSPMKDPEFVKKWQTDYFEDFFDHFGVISLTANPNNDSMWESYSDNHQGFCVGFNTIRLFQHLGGGGDVNYYDELPIIYPTPKYTYEQQHILLVFSKLRKWDYEEEYRAHKFYPYVPTDNQRRIQLPSACYEKLIFGKNMPEAIIEQLLISIPNDLGHLILIDE